MRARSSSSASLRERDENSRKLAIGGSLDHRKLIAQAERDIQRPGPIREFERDDCRVRATACRLRSAMRGASVT
jgi:hypothetical protein